MSEPPARARPKISLASEQKALVKSVRGLAERTALAVKTAYGLPQRIELLAADAHYGVVLAARDWDPASGVPFEACARVRAANAVIDGARMDRRQLKGLYGPGRRVSEHLMMEEEPAERDPFEETDESLEAELDAFTGGVTGGYAIDLADAMRTGGEDALIDRMDGARVAHALKQAFVELGPERRAILALCFAGTGEDPSRDATLDEVAERLGMNKWTLMRHRNRARDILGARLSGRGITEIPPWSGEPWASILDEEVEAFLAQADAGLESGEGG